MRNSIVKINRNKLSADCWYDNDLIAICIVVEDAKIANVYLTEAYDGQLEQHYNSIERLSVENFVFHKVNQAEISEIRNNSSLAAHRVSNENDFLTE